MVQEIGVVQMVLSMRRRKRRRKGRRRRTVCVEVLVRQKYKQGIPWLFGLSGHLGNVLLDNRHAHIS